MCSLRNVLCLVLSANQSPPSLSPGASSRASARSWEVCLKHRNIRREIPAGATLTKRGSGVRSFLSSPAADGYTYNKVTVMIAAGTKARFSRDARAVGKHPGGR